MKTVLVIATMLALLCFPDAASHTALEALRIWGLTVVPSLFPYMVLCQSLSALMMAKPERLLLLSPVLGLLGGSPAGSAALATGISASSVLPRYTLSLCALTGTISPMFFLGPVSAWLGTQADGMRLLFAHLGGAAAAAAAAMPLTSKRSIPSPLRKQDFSSPNPIIRSIDAILHVGGCIIFFSVVVGCVSHAFPALDQRTQAIIHAVFEVSGGMQALINSPLSRRGSLILLAAASGLSGFSILSQNLFFLAPVGIGMKHLLFLGFLRAAGAALIMALLC